MWVTYDSMGPFACLCACPVTVNRTVGFQYVFVGFGNDNRERWGRRVGGRAEGEKQDVKCERRTCYTLIINAAVTDRIWAIGEVTRDSNGERLVKREVRPRRGEDAEFVIVVSRTLNCPTI